MLAIGLASICLAGCNTPNPPAVSAAAADSTSQKPVLESRVAIFEIPATDLHRAVTFYEAILGVAIEKMEWPEMQMGIFPYENQMVTGVIVKSANHQPSSGGVTIYLNAGDDLQTILDKVEPHGGKVLTPKTMHADGSGFFALFQDTEGNRLGLHALK